MRVLNPEWFYNIEVTEDQIRLMGKYEKNIAFELRKYFALDVEDDGIIRGIRNGVKIVLS
jgi:hypothetical protein